MIVAKNISHKYGELEVLKGINLEINKGDLLVFKEFLVQEKQLY